MSRRLNGYLRDRIVRELLAHRFGAEERRLVEVARNVAAAIYRDAFDEGDVSRMCSLPEGWLETSAYVHATIGGRYESLCLGEERPFPHSRHDQCLGVYDGKHEIAVAFLAWKGMSDDLRSAKKRAEHAARAILESVTTVGALAARWPEATPFVPEAERVENLPALATDEVNELLGIGSKRKDAA
jgi:hypothetical protein